MMNWNSINHDRQRRDALLREAATRRAIVGCGPARQAPRALRPVLAWTGRRLVSLGFGLLVAAREWEYRSNTVYNGAKSSAQ
jgi:hypothetical protein